MKRILVVDDEEPIRKLLSRSLRMFNFDVHTAAEGSAALKLHQEKPFDLVITDIVMPGTEGLETIMALRRIQPDLKIIAMSGAGAVSGEYLPIAQKLGAAATLAKPFEFREMLDSVNSLLTEA